MCYDILVVYISFNNSFIHSFAILIFFSFYLHDLWRFSPNSPDLFPLSKNFVVSSFLIFSFKCLLLSKWSIVVKRNCHLLTKKKEEGKKLGVIFLFLKWILKKKKSKIRTSFCFLSVVVTGVVVGGVHSLYWFTTYNKEDRYMSIIVRPHIPLFCTELQLDSTFFIFVQELNKVK